MDADRQTSQITHHARQTAGRRKVICLSRSYWHARQANELPQNVSTRLLTGGG